MRGAIALGKHHHGRTAFTQLWVLGMSARPGQFLALRLRYIQVQVFGHRWPPRWVVSLALRSSSLYLINLSNFIIALHKSHAIGTYFVRFTLYTDGSDDN